MRMRLFILILASMAVAMAEVGLSQERVNRSALGGLYLSSSQEEGELLRMAKTDESSSTHVFGDADGIDGGFSSLDGMLQWAIGQSDPEKLKETAKDIQGLSADELDERRMEIKELMERLKTPSDAQLMQNAIDDLNNSSLHFEGRHRALRELLELVESIDNANDLHKLGGVATVIRELSDPDPVIRTTSAWILGTSSQNNPTVQKQVLELGALMKLMKMVRSSSAEEAIKALYAISALIRNNLVGQESFYAESGDLMLQDLLSNSSIDIRLLRKCVFLVADLAEYQLANGDRAEQPFFSNRLFLKSLVALSTSSDLDLQEKTLVAIKNVLNMKTTEALVLKDFCKLEEALERVRQQLQKLMVEEEYQREFAVDVERLRREVDQIFRRKLDKVKSVSSPGLKSVPSLGALM